MPDIEWKDRIIEFGRKPASQFQAHPNNWRKHPMRQRRAVKGSLDSLGWVDVVIENKRTGRLIDGHERIWNALQNEDAEVPYILVDLDEAEEAQALLSLDAIAALAQTDADQVDALLREVSTDDENVMEFLSDFAADSGLDWGQPESVDAEPQIDRAEELQEKWKVKTGQLWQLGNHKIICGDCTDPQVVERVMDIELNILISDPPYGVDYDANWRNEAAEKGLLSYAASRIGRVENDTRDDWRAAWKLFNGDVLYCWHADRRASSVQDSIESSGFEVRAQIIWTKPHFVIGRGHYTPRHEPCWYAIRKGKTASWIGAKMQDTVWHISLDKNVSGGHSTQKPLECMQKPIENHTGDVYDPFLGSGTTLIACQNLNRQCRGVEIAPKYCAVTLERFATAFPEEEIRLLDG